MPLLWLSLSFLAGIFLADLIHLHWLVWLSLALLCAAMTLLEKRLAGEWSRLAHLRRLAYVPLSLIAAALFLGAFRLQMHQPHFDAQDLAYYNENKVKAIGIVTAPPDLRDRAVLLRIRISEVTLPDNTWVQASGDALARVPIGKDWRYGDKVLLIGNLSTPPENEDFSYRDYLAARGIFSYMSYPYTASLERDQGNPILAGIYSLRRTAYRIVDRMFPQPEAGLVSGILLGIENDIPYDLELAFQNTGTTHIIAISGFNIAILAGLISALAMRVLPRFWAPLASVLVIALYTILVGAQASVVRAAIMGGLSLFGRQIGRRGVGVNTLAITGAAMALFNPLLPRDAGFQLSFMATLGLVLYAEPLLDTFQAWASKRLPEKTVSRLAGPVGEYILFTFAAQLTTLPVILYHFERFSFNSFLSNFLILPPQPLVMILSGLALLAGLVWFPLGQALAYLAWPFVAYTNNMVTWLSQFSGGAIVLGSVPVWVILLFYALLFGATLGKGVKERLKKISPVAVIAALALGGIVIWRAVATLPHEKLHLIALDVPDGPALLIQSPSGSQVLVNGSSSASQLSSALGQRFSLFRRKLDGMLITSRTAAPVEGIPRMLERFPAAFVLWNQDTAGYRAGERLLDTLQRQGVEPAWIETGQVIELGGGAQIHVLVDNILGTAVMVAWEDFRCLVPGGVPPETLLRSTDVGITGVDVILLGEEDIEAAPAGEWEALNAALYIWAGAGDQSIPAYDPHWAALGQHGWIEIETDGARMWAVSAKASR